MANPLVEVRREKVNEYLADLRKMERGQTAKFKQKLRAVRRGVFGAIKNIYVRDDHELVLLSVGPYIKAVNATRTKR